MYVCECVLTVASCITWHYLILPRWLSCLATKGGRAAVSISLPLKLSSWGPGIPVSQLSSCLSRAQLLMADKWQSSHWVWKLRLLAGTTAAVPTPLRSPVLSGATGDLWPPWAAALLYLQWQGLLLCPVLALCVSVWVPVYFFSRCLCTPEEHNSSKHCVPPCFPHSQHLLLPSADYQGPCHPPWESCGSLKESFT